MAERSGEPRRIVVVGAGECGARVVLKLRDLGWTGELTLVGDEFDPPYERPGLSKSALTHDTPPPAIVSLDRLVELDIGFAAGVGALDIDRAARRVVLADGRTVAYDRLLLATGARARVPAIEGADAVVTLRSLADARHLRRRLASGVGVLIIGGGFIGLEVAASASQLGCSVTVIEYAHRVISRVVPTAVADVVLQRHVEAGVDVRCGVGAESVATTVTGTYRTTLTNGTTLASDLVVAGVGAVPNTRLAAQAGLSLDNGIRVGPTLCTDDEAIFAAGDCCSFPHPLYGGQRVRIEAWRNALDQVEVVAENLLGAARVYDAVPTFWSNQYELTIQIAGLHEHAVAEVVRCRDDDVELRFGLDHTGRLVSASGVAVGNALARDIRLAEHIIEQRAIPHRTHLSDPHVPLRSLLR